MILRVRRNFFEITTFPNIDFEELLDGRKAVGYRWILKGRQTMMVSITIKKARLVAKDVFRQVQGVDYDEIFSSVAMLKSVRIMLALAAFMKSGRWMSKQVSLPVFVRKGCM